MRDKVKLYTKRSPEGVLVITDDIETAIAGFAGPVFVNAHLYEAWRRVTDICEGVMQSIEATGMSKKEIGRRFTDTRGEPFEPPTSPHAKQPSHPLHSVYGVPPDQQTTPDLDELEEQIDPTAGGRITTQEMVTDIQDALTVARKMGSRTDGDKDFRLLTRLELKYGMAVTP